MDRARLAISITAHERIDVLRGQVLNILHFCEDPIVVVHVNAAFRASLDADAAGASTLSRIAGMPGVIVNPEHLPTKWAHMFHGHVSNIRCLERIGAAYTHFVLASSADLFFRRGAEAHVAAFDAGLDGVASFARGAGGGGWATQIAADDVFWRMLADCGAERGATCLHEGTFYRRETLLRAIEVIERYVSDWDYNDSYPKEEYFLPSLVRVLQPEARTAPRLGKILGVHDWKAQRQFVQQVLRLLGADSAGSGPLAAWLSDPEMASQAEQIRLEQHFMLARLVRSATDPLRQLLTNLSAPAPAWERAELAERLDCFDVLSLDLPGRRYSRRAVVFSSAASHLLRDRPADVLLDALGTERPISTREIAVCPGAYLPPQRIWSSEAPIGSVGRLASCATHITEVGTRLSASVSDRLLRLSLDVPKLSETTGAHAGPDQIFVFWASPALEPTRHRAIRLTLSGSAELTEGLTCWIEYHGKAGKRTIETGGLVLSGLTGEEDKRFILLRGEVMRRAVHELGPGVFQIYIGMRPVTGHLSISEVAALF